MLIIERGSRINSISDRIVALYRKLHRMKPKPAPTWIPRSDHITAPADSASKPKDTDDWGPSEKSFKILQEPSPTKPTVDTLANCTNKKCSKFHSKAPSPGSSGANCFMSDLNESLQRPSGSMPTGSLSPPTALRSHSPLIRAMSNPTGQSPPVTAAKVPETAISQHFDSKNVHFPPIAKSSKHFLCLLSQNLPNLPE